VAGGGQEHADEQSGDDGSLHGSIVPQVGAEGTEETEGTGPHGGTGERRRTVIRQESVRLPASARKHDEFLL
jgi:hypothetical protein